LFQNVEITIEFGDFMGRFTGKTNRIARRYGANIFGRRRNPLIHKPNPPGMHAARRRKKSDYGLQLEEKQKLKACYGLLSEKQLVRYFREAARRKGNTMTHLLELLECRLDMVVYRLTMGSTIFHAHQLVSHGHILVDGKKVDRRSYIVKPGQTITIRERSRKNKAILESLETNPNEVPGYLSMDKSTFSGTLLNLPGEDQIPLPVPVNVPVVCEFLAHHT
jgi:small subunit ribosomal protein S4